MDTDATDGLAIAKRLEAHPILAARFLRILEIAEDSGGDLRRADDAEQRAIDELRVLGQEVLRDWGQRREEIEFAKARQQGNVCSWSKELHWHSASQTNRDRVPGRGVRSDLEVTDSGKVWEPFSLRPQADSRIVTDTSTTEMLSIQLPGRANNLSQVGSYRSVIDSSMAFVTGFIR